MTVCYNWLLEETNTKSTVQLLSQNINSINNKHLERLIAKVNYSNEHLIWITVCRLVSTVVLKEPSTADFYCYCPCDAIRPSAGESFVVSGEWLEQEVKTIDTNKELMGIHGKLGRQFFFPPTLLFGGQLHPPGLEASHRESLSVVIIPHLVAALG